MGNIIVGGVVVILIGLAVGSMVRDKKKGKSLGCGCDCSHCSGHCNPSENNK